MAALRPELPLHYLAARAVQCCATLTTGLDSQHGATLPAIARTPASSLHIKTDRRARERETMEGVTSSFRNIFTNTEEEVEEQTDLKTNNNIEIEISEAREICHFYLANKCRFGDHCRNRHEGPTLQAEKTKRKRRPPDQTAEREERKKPPMKTAADVIKRLQWDEQLPQEIFTIGYLDRFLGIVEEKFSNFSWEDLASADYDTLAIPQHRIQYFKYKTEKVWEKTTRLDIVFGSTGSKIGIAEFMQNLDYLEYKDSLSADEKTPQKNKMN